MTLRWDTRSRVGQSVKNWINPSVTVEYLIIAGGGGGGSASDSWSGAGAGAGGYRTGNSAISVGAGSYVITVGAGGAGGVNSADNGADGAKGSDSVFSGITSTGGGLGNGRANTITDRKSVV